MLYNIHQINRFSRKGMNRKWELYEPDDDLVQKVAYENSISETLATILVNRNIVDEEEIQVFLNPTRKDFHDPYLMPDMEKAIERIIKAIENKEKIIIYGDYDVDGITSITVLKKFFAEQGVEVDYTIPNRLEEGYGLNKEAIKKIKDENYDLIITVDCGISAIEEIKYANELGLEVIVTDHHEPVKILPDAVAIIDCKRKDSTYPFKSLAGVGVVFKLIQALSIKLELKEEAYLKYLDIVCIGTISDIVPLIDENRVIAKLGLKLVKVTKNIGLKVLLQTIGYKEINSTTISFGIAPRINACGRMGHENEAVKLFFTENEKEAFEITDKLNNYNRERQEIEKRIFEEALIKIKNENLDKKSSIVLAENNWHHGVIGIVASKITDLYYKPSILICLENGKGKGSGRSISGFDLHDALCKTSNYLDKYGGHEMAVGLSLEENQFSKFKEEFEKLSDKAGIDNLVSVIKVDKQITNKDVNFELINSLKLLEPFGESNEMPIFIYKNLKIDSIRSFSEGKHLRLTLKDGNKLINAIGFNKGNLSVDYTIGDKIDILGILEINSYNGNEIIQINMKDIRKSY